MLEFFDIGLMVFLIFIILSGLTALFGYGIAKFILWLDDKIDG
jgi:hypothetical protein